jgi:SAM-dependent methyltransferase
MPLLERAAISHPHCTCAGQIGLLKIEEIMIESILGKIHGGRVLDVATREGHFVQVLMSNLHSYSEIIGIDIDPHAIETAHEHLAGEQVQFFVMDAQRLGFNDDSLDTVNISASLHHLVHIPRVLGEMLRVLKSGGQFLLLEMHCDGLTEAELTTVSLHHWIADIETELGCLHLHTLPRQTLVDYVSGLGLSAVKYYDDYDKDSDPLDLRRIEEFDNLIEKTLQRAEGTKNYPTFAAKGNELRHRLHQLGARREPRLIIVGEK